MPRHLEQTRARIAQTASRLRSLAYSETIAPDTLLVGGPTERGGWAETSGLEFRPATLGEEFGPQWSTFWFRIEGRVPGTWSGSRVDLIWDSNCEAAVWRDGRILQGLYSGWRALRTTAPLTMSAAGGDDISVAVEMACNSWAGDDPDPEPGVDPERAARFRLGRNWTEHASVRAPRHVPAPARLTACALGRFDPVAWRLAWDLEVLRELETECAGPERDWGDELLGALNEFCNRWDATERDTWEPAGALLGDLLERRGPTPRHRAYALGHAHIDTAWVWPAAETRRKIVRSTANQLELMERYPEHRFAASSAQHYAWLEEDAPELFARVAERVAEGRWEVVGGSWVEPDCNLPRGESLIRQLLVGQRYFERRFGKRCDVYWSPDTFGHNGQLPQILRECGIGRFMTQKLAWNQFTAPPHDSFRWRGIDGTEVIAHLPPVKTYNAKLTVAELRRAQAAFLDHDRARSELVLFGHGDGGGGPTAEMLERAGRFGDLRGLPEVELALSNRLFAELEEDPARLGAITGQLYFEYHRGTYTSQAVTKQGNREGERSLHEAEAAAAIAWATTGADYPTEELDRVWPVLLRNQFHDILPGTSLGEVHATTAVEHRKLIASAEALRDSAAESIVRPGDGAGLNLTGFDRSDVLETPEGLRFTQSPAFAFGVVAEPEAPVRLSSEAGRTTLENGLIAAVLDEQGRLISLRRAEGQHELLAAPAGYSLFEDRPTAFDAWELEPYYREVARPVADAQARQLVVDDPLRAEVGFEHRLGVASRFEQRVRLDAGSPRLEFRLRVDWHERHCLLRFLLPLVVRAERATYGAQFGVHELSTHQNTDADLAHFEAPGLGFVDLGEPGLGAALLSSTNYGFSAIGSELGLSLLRSPTDPDPEADQGVHELCFAIQPHAGDWRTAGIVRSAEALANPQRWITGAGPSPAFARVTDDGLAIDTLKRSEDGTALIVRLHEPSGSRGVARLELAVEIAAAERTNALEDSPGQPLAADGNSVVVPYRPFELITLRLQLAG